LANKVLNVILNIFALDPKRTNVNFVFIKRTCYR